MDNKVTILLATHNRAHLIGKTLNSIENQTYINWECVIVDDFSSDSTMEVVNNYLQKDARFSFFLKPEGMNRGLSASRNYGLELVKERDVPVFVQFFDDDDLMHPHKLELQVKSLLNNPSAQFVICGAKNFLNEKEITLEETVKPITLNRLSLGEAYLTGKIRFVAQVPLFRYNYAKNFRFDEAFFYAEEWVLFSKHFLFQEPIFTELEKTLFYRRKHPESITEDHDENFQKRKTNAITDVKIYNFLTENEVHTKVTLFYFTRKFLLYKYDSPLLDSIQKEIIRNKATTKSDYLKFYLSQKIHWFARKLVLRILKF